MTHRPTTTTTGSTVAVRHTARSVTLLPCYRTEPTQCGLLQVGWWRHHTCWQCTVYCISLARQSSHRPKCGV